MIKLYWRSLARIHLSRFREMEAVAGRKDGRKEGFFLSFLARLPFQPNRAAVPVNN